MIPASGPPPGDCPVAVDDSVVSGLGDEPGMCPARGVALTADWALSFKAEKKLDMMLLW